MLIPNIRAFVLLLYLGRSRAGQGVQCVDTASGRERKCLWARSRSVATNQPNSEETLGCWNTSQEEDTAPVRFPQGPMSDQRSLGRQGGNESSRLVQLRRCRPLALDQVFETGRVGWWMAGLARRLYGWQQRAPAWASPLFPTSRLLVVSDLGNGGNAHRGQVPSCNLSLPHIAPGCIESLVFDPVCPI